MTHPQNDPLVGARIREYEILELLGKGGMGAVYRARHSYLDEERALKVIHSSHSKDSGFVDRFIREAKILTKLRHPNLVQLFEFGSLDEDSFFMVMELIRGESVWQRIKRLGRLSPSDAVKMIREAASGLQCAHQNGIIHRDLSPDNLILLNDRQPEITKVIDFGIAKPLFESSLQLTASNLFIGKPEYCSPEQCTFSENKEPLDARSDIYSLAVTFYQMVTGTLPFYSKSPQGYFMKHAHELPDPPSSHLPAGSFPESLDRLILKALSKKREERHIDVSEFLAELNAFEQPLSLPVPLFAEPEIGAMFAGRYLIEEKLGKGEMGLIFRATDQILDISVALKTISFDIAEDDKMLARFKREVILARKVSHPNVCRVYDIGESGGVHYVSMELVEGRTLADYMRAQGRLSIEEALPILEQLLFAIRETHRAGIIHRDLKPQNIMIDQRLRLKIMDFGISLSPDFSRITQTGSLMGTPHYMAPEIFEEKPVDQRADLYSFGVLMYTLFTGKLPFDGPTPVAVVYAHLKGDPARPSGIIPSFPERLEQVILKTLQKEPEKRYETADQILQDLAFLTQPSSDLEQQASERLTHKLIAEHRYGKAIKVLQALLKQDPENLQWKKLLKNAIAEKTKREIRRTRLLIRKGNWLQAEVCLDRFRRSQLEIAGVLNQIRKLQQLLISGKKQSVETYIKEALQRLSTRDYLAAMASLESAWHLQPNDPAIVQMQKQIQLAQEEEANQRHETRLIEARSLLTRGQDEQAFFLVEQVLDENPSHKSAKDLRDQILENRWEQVQVQIRQQLELALQPLSFCDFEVTLELLKKLQKELEIESCRKEIDRLWNAVARLYSVFQSEEYYDVPVIVQKLLSKDPFKWLEAHHDAFAGIERIANERFVDRQTVIRNAMVESKDLLASGRHTEALARVEGLLSRRQVPEAEDLRVEILNAYRESMMQEAREFALHLNWEGAIRCWKEALTLFPDSPDIRQFISDSEEHLRNELRLQQQLLSQLKNCYSLILKDHWVEAQELVETMLKSIQPGYRLIETERQIEELQDVIVLHNREQQNQKQASSRELAGIRKLYKRGLYAEALEKISWILENDEVQEEAVELKIAIEKAIETQSVSTRFQSAVQKGKEYYEQRNWQKAIEFWKKASALSEETYVKDWIDEAQKRLKKERQTRLSIIAMLAEAEELIFYGKFLEAGRKLEKCRKALSDDFAMTDLFEQVHMLTLKLEEEVRKDEALHAAIQSELEEASLLHHQKQYTQALQKLDAILQQQPEMESALQLKSQIEKEEGENRSVLEILRAIVKLFIKRDFKQLPGLLLRLKENSSGTPYAEDCKSIIDEMPLLALEIESANQASAQERLNRLLSRSLLLLEYEQTLRKFIDTLYERIEKERELQSALERGIKSLESGDRQGALECLESFQQIFGRRRRQPMIRSQESLDRTATLSEEDLKLTEMELQTLQQVLLHQEVESVLAAARERLIGGDKERAHELYVEALKMEPDNVAAREALRDLEQSE